MVALRRRVGAFLFLLAAEIGSSVSAAPTIRVLSDRTLAGAASKALDIRWSSADSVYVTTMAAGVLELDARDPARTVSVSFARNGGCWSCARIGASTKYVATAFDVGRVEWKSVDSPQLHPAVFDAVVDLDVHGDQLLLLGSRREEGKWAPDGAIAWKGSFSKGLSDLHPVVYSALGPKATVVAKCGFLEPGGARFFADGSFVVVPGVEPGAFLYDAGGKLVYTWQTDALGFQDRCNLNEEDVLLYSANPEARAQWAARRVFVDDVLPLPEGPGLILRNVREGVTSWNILVLRRGLAPLRIALPFTSSTDVAHLKADVRGNRLAFLIRTSGAWRTGWKPVAARLIIGERQ